MNFERLCWVILAFACLRVGQWLPEADRHRQQQATIATGVYTPAAPAPRFYVDCSAEGREICKRQRAMEKVRGKAT